MDTDMEDITTTMIRLSLRAPIKATPVLGLQESGCM